MQEFQQTAPTLQLNRKKTHFPFLSVLSQFIGSICELQEISRKAILPMKKCRVRNHGFGRPYLDSQKNVKF